jgi:hypothetical protein
MGSLSHEERGGGVPEIMGAGRLPQSRAYQSPFPSLRSFGDWQRAIVTLALGDSPSRSRPACSNGKVTWILGLARPGTTTVGAGWVATEDVGK